MSVDKTTMPKAAKMKQSNALKALMARPWYRAEMYLATWREASGLRYYVLTPKGVIGWGISLSNRELKRSR